MLVIIVIWGLGIVVLEYIVSKRAVQVFLGGDGGGGTEQRRRRSSRRTSILVTAIGSTSSRLRLDVVALGVNILSAWTGDLGPSSLPTDQRKVKFNILFDSDPVESFRLVLERNLPPHSRQTRKLDLSCYINCVPGEDERFSSMSVSFFLFFSFNFTCTIQKLCFDFQPPKKRKFRSIEKMKFDNLEFQYDGRFGHIQSISIVLNILLGFLILNIMPLICYKF